MANEVADLLRAAKAKVEEGWTQGAFARDERGNHISMYSPDAVCWCASGALGAAQRKVSKGSSFGHRNHTVYMSAYCLLSEDVASWNDAPGQTQEGVLAGFDSAIAHAEVLARHAPEKE